MSEKRGEVSRHVWKLRTIWLIMKLDTEGDAPLGEMARSEKEKTMIRIFADSTCDLSEELVSHYHITILPLHVVLGEDEYLDGKNIAPDEIYAWSNAHKLPPKTSAVSMDVVEEAMRPALEAGDELICFSISASMSTSGNVMRLTAESLDAADRVSVVDSMNLSTGIGLMVIEAALMARSGMSREAIVAHIEALKPRIRTSFVVDTLTYLHRGGRCSGAAALAGSALKLHPRIAVSEGKMTPGKKYRGAMNKVVLAYAKDMEEDLLKADVRRVFLTHSGCPQADLDEVKAYLESLGRFEEILVARAGGVISCHCGPGALGVIFIAGE